VYSKVQMKVRWRSAGWLLILLACPAVAQEEGARALWDTQFLRQRPPAKKAIAAPPKAPTVVPATLPAPVPLVADNFSDRLLGFTMWRLRPSLTADEPGARILMHSERDKEWTPERISVGTALTESQFVRFSIESARPGYLYVIDREQYEDGSVGEPFLIFPTTKTRGGDNRVAPGIVVELPAWDDKPNYMWLKRSRADHVGELLTILVASQPLPGIAIGPEPLPLEAAQLAGWEATWGAKVERLDAAAPGKAYTAVEQAAGTGRRPLTQSDPLPHTLYRVEGKTGDPLLVKVPLKILR